jgi:hypothetical protein
MARNKSVESVIQEKDFDAVWDYLEKKFGYSKQWRIECRKYVYERQQHISYKPNPVADFLFYCRREINPLLNAARCRHDSIQPLCECFIGCLEIASGYRTVRKL